MTCSHRRARLHPTRKRRGFSRSKTDKGALGEEARDMVRRRRSKKEGVVSKKKAKRATGTWSYRDLYEDWLQKQVVESREAAPEVKIPTDTF